MDHSRNVYLKMKTLKAAREILFKKFPMTSVLSSEDVSTPDSVGRVLSQPVTARLSSPGFHSSAMDGLAVKAEFTYGATETKPKELVIGKDAFYINTGQVMPKECNAVIMIEHINAIDEKRIEIEAPVFPWQHVRKVGEDIVATELLFPRDHVVTPYCVGALLSGGIFSVSVKKKPKVLIIPTGSELVNWQDASIEDLKPGNIYDTNSFMLGKLVESDGGIYVRHDILKDDLEKIKQAVNHAAMSDVNIILLIGGSSAGSEDHTRSVIAEIGEVLVHGVTIMPGKPVIIGKVNNLPVFGIPGFPVSAIISFEQFVSPLICRMLGQPGKVRQTVQVEPTRKIASRLGVEEFLRVKLGVVGGKIVATPLPRGAGCITSITQADGIIRIPNHVEGLKDHEQAVAELLRPLSSIQNTIVMVGSHDNTLDVLSDHLKTRRSGLTLSSSHVGSMGGLMAIKRGVCHLAGIHLLDTEDGSYNTTYIRKYLPDIAVNLVNLVYRDQGLIVLSGNPKGIKGVKDLAMDDITFINRQKGSGTRILLDYRLKEIGVDAGKIDGYENDEFTHMSVAVAVQSGSADVGLGIYAAAKALGLDFIPVVTEQYDLVIPQEHVDSENIQLLLETINTEEFKERVRALGGYSTEKTGCLIEV
jgi:putative molybdopterin biosynthesis protein